MFAPVFNQVDDLPRVLDEFREADLGRYGVDLLLVDNGSSDGSEEVVRQSGHAQLRVPVNRGVGHALALAIDWGLARDYDVLVTMATNGKMLPSEMPRLLEPVYRGEVDHARGSRFMRGGASPNLTRFRRLAIPMVNVLVFLAVRQYFTDATCGYRALRLEPLRRATFDIHAPWLETYGLEYYLDAKFALDRRLRVREFPITMRYPPKGRPYSKIRGLIDYQAMLRPWFAAALDGERFAPLSS